MKYLAKKPGISKANKARLNNDLEDADDIKSKEKNPSHFFQPIDDGWIDDQEEDVEAFEWSGRISPSAKLYKDTCVEEFFTERVDKALSFDPNTTLKNVRGGQMLHEAFFIEADKYIPFKKKPKFAYPELETFAEKIYPEWPAEDLELGIRGKIDRLISIDGELGIFDLKTKFIAPDSWKKLRAQLAKGIWMWPEHRMQVRYYAAILKEYPYFFKKDGTPIVPKWIGVGYFNVPSASPWLAPKSRIEIWERYTEKDHKETRLHQKAFGLGGRLKKAEKRIICRNIFCSRHGVAA